MTYIKLTLMLLITMLVISGCCSKQIECDKPAKQISKMTGGLQYSHCYDANYTW